MACVYILFSSQTIIFTYHFHFTPADITTQFNPNHLSLGARGSQHRQPPSHKYSNCRHLSHLSSAALHLPACLSEPEELSRKISISLFYPSHPSRGDFYQIM